jgi:hypothetical protein
MGMVLVDRAAQALPIELLGAGRASTPIMMALTCRDTVVSFLRCLEHLELNDET